MVSLQQNIKSLVKSLVNPYFWWISRGEIPKLLAEIRECSNKGEQVFNICSS